MTLGPNERDTSSITYCGRSLASSAPFRGGVVDFANDEIRDSSDVIVRYPETSSDSDDSDRREIVLPIDSSIIDDYGDFDALEKLAELMQEKGLTQDDLLVVLNAVKLKNIEK